MTAIDISGYEYTTEELGTSHAFLLPAISKILPSLDLSSKRAFDLGCGNGSVAYWLAQRGFEVAGVDPSETGIKQASAAFPGLRFQVGSAYDPLNETFGQYPLVVSLEVVEHVYAPRKYAKCVSDLLTPGGYALISTPYHGYWKNLALALTGKMDQHFTALWDHGHIKFWSAKTLTQLLTEAGLNVKQIVRTGRVPQLAKSMIVVVQKQP